MSDQTQPTHSESHVDQVVLHGVISIAKNILYAVLGVGLAQLALTVGILITDHFSLKNMVEDMAVVKPRVEHLWWKHQPLGNERTTLSGNPNTGELK